MRFLSKTAQSIEPYVPGEQPKDKSYIKLNTNESPYPPCPLAGQVIETFNYEDLRLYPDFKASAFRAAIAKTLGVNVNSVFAGAGSDAVLGYAFQAFFDRGDTVVYPDITYGFYSVLAKLYGLNPVEIPLDANFRVNTDGLINAKGHIVIANPNAPTGIALTTAEIEHILSSDRDRLVIIDEAYTGFSDKGNSEPLLSRYDNLLIIRTMSKSYAAAGMRLAYALGSPELIDALDRIKDSFDPYNFDRLSIDVGIAAITDTKYLRNTIDRIVKTREEFRISLDRLGFETLPSDANFLFTRKQGVDGKGLYLALKDAGILVRWFNKPRIRDFIRISIGTSRDMKRLVKTLEEIL